MRLTFKSNVNANGKTGIVINAYRITKAWALIKEGSVKSGLSFFDAGYEFKGDKK